MTAILAPPPRQRKVKVVHQRISRIHRHDLRKQKLQARNSPRCPHCTSTGLRLIKASVHTLCTTLLTTRFDIKPRCCSTEFTEKEVCHGT